VYVPSAPPAATQVPAAEGAPAMVIEEPAPPEPPATPPPETTTSKETPHPHRRVLHKEPPPEDTETTPETTEPPLPPQVPSLEPRESHAEEEGLRRQIQGLQDDVRQRIAKLNLAGLSGADRKTLDDARTFFAQSTRALNEADLQRALNLARKASLLVLALEH
jgi:outer membrane biosynthesis protein TonB